AKPLDAELILGQAKGKKLVVTLEESVVSGCFGSPVLDLLADSGLADSSLRGLPVRLIGLPGAKFVDHASAADLRRVLRIDTPGITAQIHEGIETLRLEGSHADFEARTA